MTIAKLRLATSERRKDKDGNWADHTEWHRVTCFGRTAENVAKFCKKGKTLYIDGTLRTQKWQDKDGKDQYTTEVVANEVRFLGGGQSEGGGSGGRGGYGGSSGGSQRGGAGGGGGRDPQQDSGGFDGGSDDDSIPF
jgi:single-strand DNA-binding protein